MSRFGEPKPVERIKVLPQKTIRKVASKQTDMSRFGEPKPVERIKVLPQKTIKKVASKQDYSWGKAFILIWGKTFSL